MANFSEVENDVWQAVQKLNECWTRHGGNGLADYFHEKMVAITPVDRLRRVGRDSCFQGWMNFVNTVEIISWEEHEPLVNVFSNAAVVTYYYTMRCIIAEESVTLEGRDMFFMIRENGSWLAVADQFSGYPVQG